MPAPARLASDRLQPGDRLASIPAAAWNSFIDAAAFVRQQRALGIGGVSPVAAAGGIVTIRNDSGADRSRFEILRVTDFLFTRTENQQHFENVPALVGGTPNTTLSQTFAILQEPIAAGSVGRAMLAGVTPVQIDVIDADDTAADVISSDCAKLRSYPFGCLPILAKESGTGTKWAYVLMAGFARQPAIGKADSAITQGNSGTVSVWSDSTTTLADTGQNVTAYARYGDVTSGDWLQLLPHQWGWEAVQQPCA